MSEKTFPTIGYWRNEQRTFHLREGETLPKGWYNSASKAATRSLGESPPGDPTIQQESETERYPKKRGPGRPRKVHDEQPGAELASELRDE